MSKNIVLLVVMVIMVTWLSQSSYAVVGASIDEELSQQVVESDSSDRVVAAEPGAQKSQKKKNSEDLAENVNENTELWFDHY